jgi:NADH:ubiquinone oxidoreductase subunit C
MDNGEEILAQLSPGKSWEKRSDGWWLETRDMDVEKMAHLMTEAKARLVTITAYEVSNGEFRIIYHWDLEGRMLNIIAMTCKKSIPSIAMIHPASDWIEREIHDYFAVQFTGRELPPLLLNPEDSPGIFLDHPRTEHEKGKGKEK